MGAVLFFVLGCQTDSAELKLRESKNDMRLTPVTRRELIKRLRNLGWDGPFPGGKHQFMVRGAMKLPVPNPHGGVLSVGMVSEILKETEISREDWLSAG